MDEATRKAFREQIENHAPGLPFHEAAASYILGQWPAAKVRDGQTFAKAFAAVLAKHPEAAVLQAADPTAGIAAECDKLPTIKQLVEVMRKIGSAAEAERRAAEPRPEPPRRRPEPREPLAPVINLFVPEGFPGYARMIELHQQTGGARSFHDRKMCVDGVIRTGIMVPATWWERGEAAPISNLQRDEEVML